MTCLVFMLHLCIRYRSKAVRTPVDNPLASIYKVFIIKLNKYLFYRFITSFIHCKTFSVPVTGRTHFFKLRYYTSAVLIFPIPRTLKKSFSSNILFRNAFLTHGFNNLSLCCNRSMVSSRNPECVISLHPFISYKYILKFIIKGMAHVKLTCNIRRRHHNREWLFTPVNFCMEILLIHPFFIKLILNIRRIICLFKLLFHNYPHFLLLCINIISYSILKAFLCQGQVCILLAVIAPVGHIFLH